MPPRSLLPLLLLILPTSACRSVEAPLEPPSDAGLFDHHVHLLSPQLVNDWKGLGVPFLRPDEVYQTAAGLLEPEDGATMPALAGAVLVPMAHFYASIELREALGFSLQEEQARVRGENEYVAREAERWGRRTIALASVDYSRTYAREEAERALSDGASGLKLHLGSASPDLTDHATLEELAAWFAWADEDNFGVLLHLDPQRRGLDKEDVTVFLQRVLGPLPDVRVVVAHLGGSGGFGPWTQDVIGALTDWLSAEEAAGRPRPGILADISAVLLQEESEGVPATTPEEAAALGDALRRLGLDRVVFGSDYPVFAPTETLAQLRVRTDLTPSELAQLLANRARW